MSVSSVLTAITTRLSEPSTYAGIASIISTTIIGLEGATNLHGAPLIAALVVAAASAVVAVVKAEGSTSATTTQVVAVATQVAAVATVIENDLPKTTA